MKIIDLKEVDGVFVPAEEVPKQKKEKTRKLKVEKIKESETAIVSESSEKPRLPQEFLDFLNGMDLIKDIIER